MPMNVADSRSVGFNAPLWRPGPRKKAAILLEWRPIPARCASLTRTRNPLFRAIRCGEIRARIRPPAQIDSVARAASSGVAAKAQDQHSRLGHRFHRPAHALAAEPRALDPAERIGVDAEHSGVADDHRSRLDLAKRHEGMLQVGGEDSRLQAIRRIVGGRDPLGEGVDRLDGRDRPENFLTPDA